MINTLMEPVGKLGFAVTLPLLRLRLNNSKRARIMVMHGEEFLAVKHFLGDGTWMLPGGGIHKKEESRPAVLRELKEETRIVSYPERLYFLGEDKHTASGLRYDYECYFLRVDHKPKVRIGWPEVIGYRWIRIGEADDYRLSEEARFAVDRYRSLAQG